MSKCPAILAYIGNIINYLWHLFAPFPRGLWKDLEGSSTFLPLMLLMHIDRLGLFSNLYRVLFIYLSAGAGSCVGATAL